VTAPSDLVDALTRPPCCGDAGDRRHRGGHGDERLRSDYSAPVSETPTPAASFTDSQSSAPAARRRRWWNSESAAEAHHHNRAPSGGEAACDRVGARDAQAEAETCRAVDQSAAADTHQPTVKPTPTSTPTPSPSPSASTAAPDGAGSSGERACRVAAVGRDGASGRTPVSRRARNRSRERR